MSLAPGTRLGPYEVVAAIGAGGMGEVYRAHDTRLKRDVALKVLPDTFTSDPERLARFQREAEVLATLNHPHIAHIHGVEETDSHRALVMELVEGEDLSQRIARARVPLEEALLIARQITDALEAAHDRGIVHRDLKPANIKLRSDGTVKVLDFGLAKAIEDRLVNGGSPVTPHLATLANSPTITSPALTIQGTLLGTAAYMSPEQAKGRPASKRSDIWSFGAVLFEMLAGRRAFEGEDASDTLASVLKGTVDWSLLPSDIPEALSRLLRRCLTRDPRSRLADIADARLELDAATASAHIPEPSLDVYKHSRRWAERAVWVVLLAATAYLAWRTAITPETIAPELRVDIVTPPSSIIADPSIALSPDGRRIAFVADDGRRGRLWVRQLDTGIARPIAGTDSARLPFWSDDGRAIGFFALTQLKTVDLETGAIETLASVIGAGGGTWAGNTIVYAPNSGVGPLFRIDSKGGRPTPITTIGANVTVHRHPMFLPDGQRFLYLEVRPPQSQLFVGYLDGRPAAPLVMATGGALYSGTGHLLWVRQGALVAQPFDVSTLKLTGTAKLLVEQVALNEVGRPAAAVSTSGTLAYRAGSGPPMRQFAWFDRAGKEIAKIGTPEGYQSNPELAPNGARLALQRSVNGNVDVWLLDLARGLFNRVTHDLAIDALPLWSPDSARLVFTSNRGASTSSQELTPDGLAPGAGTLFVMSADNSGAAQILVRSDEAKWPNTWSPNGHQIIFRSLNSKTGTHDLWVTDVDRPSPTPLVATAADERDAQFSPDGRWIAFQSDESGQPEIYLQRFPGPGGKERVSSGGGTQVRWRMDGKELFYVTSANELAAVNIQLPSAEGSARLESPRVLFPTRLVNGGFGVPRQQYVVSADGQRFLLNSRESASEAVPITLLLNWQGARGR